MQPRPEAALQRAALQERPIGGRALSCAGPVRLELIRSDPFRFDLRWQAERKLEFDQTRATRANEPASTMTTPIRVGLCGRAGCSLGRPQLVWQSADSLAACARVCVASGHSEASQTINLLVRGHSMHRPSARVDHTNQVPNWVEARTGSSLYGHYRVHAQLALARLMAASAKLERDASQRSSQIVPFGSPLCSDRTRQD